MTETLSATHVRAARLAAAVFALVALATLAHGASAAPTSFSPSAGLRISLVQSATAVPTNGVMGFSGVIRFPASASSVQARLQVDGWSTNARSTSTLPRKEPARSPSPGHSTDSACRPARTRSRSHSTPTSAAATSRPMSPRRCASTILRSGPSRPSCWSRCTPARLPTPAERSGPIRRARLARERATRWTASPRWPQTTWARA